MLERIEFCINWIFDEIKIWWIEKEIRKLKNELKKDGLA